MNFSERIAGLFQSQPERHHYTMVPIDWNQMHVNLDELYYYQPGIASTVAYETGLNTIISNKIAETLFDASSVFGFSPEYFDIGRRILPKLSVMSIEHDSRGAGGMRPRLLFGHGYADRLIKGVSTNDMIDLMSYLAHEMYHVRQLFQDSKYVEMTAQGSDFIFSSEQKQNVRLYEMNLGERSATAFCLRYLLEKERQLAARGELSPLDQEILAALPIRRQQLIEKFIVRLNKV